MKNQQKRHNLQVIVITGFLGLSLSLVYPVPTFGCSPWAVQGGMVNYSSSDSSSDSSGSWFGGRCSLDGKKRFPNEIPIRRWAQSVVCWDRRYTQYSMYICGLGKGREGKGECVWLVCCDPDSEVLENVNVIRVR